MLSSIRVPEKSLHPALSVNAATSTPILTHEVWILLIRPRKNSREKAYMRKSSAPLGGGGATNPLRNNTVF